MTSVSPPLISTVVLASRSSVLGMLSGGVTSPGVLETTLSCMSTKPSAETCGTACRMIPVVMSWNATACAPPPLPMMVPALGRRTRWMSTLAMQAG